MLAFTHCGSFYLHTHRFALSNDPWIQLKIRKRFYFFHLLTLFFPPWHTSFLIQPPTFCVLDHGQTILQPQINYINNLNTFFHALQRTDHTDHTNDASWLSSILIPVSPTELWNNLYFGILGWIFINTFNIFPSPPLNEQTWLARHVSI
jgi:hypothetical protein